MKGNKFRIWLHEEIQNEVDGEWLRMILNENPNYVFPYGAFQGRRVADVPLSYLKLALRSNDLVPPEGREAIKSFLLSAPASSPSRTTPRANAAMPQQQRERATQPIRLNVPFKDNPRVKSLGAVFDDGTKFDQGKGWFISPGMYVDRFQEWLPQSAPARNPVVPSKSQTPTQQRNQPGTMLRPGESKGDPWICCTVTPQNEFGYPATVPGPDGQPEPYRVVVRGPDANGMWELGDEHFRVKKGITTQEIKKNVVSLRDAENKGVKTRFPMNYLSPKKPKKVKGKTIENLTEEQMQIDARFARMMASKSQDHMTISALAGTGKTTMLKHLAAKYGSPGQKWLYLVFNTANKEEAIPEFPDWVEVNTTNSFLGRMLSNSDNKARFPQTDWIARLGGGGGAKKGGRKLEKSSITADTKEFAAMMDRLGVPDPDLVENRVTSRHTLKILRDVRKTFQRSTLKLLGLAKSYALDPRSPTDAMAGLELVVEDYGDNIDTKMLDVKDKLLRLNRREPYEFPKVVADLRNLFSSKIHDAHGFMGVNLSKEIMTAAYWMMQQAMPHASQHEYEHEDGKKHRLADYRDFDDDLWYPSIHADELHWPHYDVVLADEVQDFNENQKIMLKKLAEAGAKIVAVGDVNQSMYRFRGADSAAFQSLSSMLKGMSSNQNDVEQTLTKNFRSRPAILDYSNQTTHVKDLKPGRKFDDLYNGEVRDNEDGYEDIFAKLKDEQSLFGNRMETAIISRTNEPLVHAALRLMTDGTPFVIVGKDISKSLREHINKVKKEANIRDYSGVSDLTRTLEDFYREEEHTFRKERTKDAYLKELKETTQALMSAIDQFRKDAAKQQTSDDPYANQPDEPTVREFERWLYERLGGLNVEDDPKQKAEYKRKLEAQNPVVLTTSHRSKGLEFDRVYILRSDQFPHPRSRNNPKDLAQEANAKYVSLTRPKKVLSVVKLDDQPGYEGSKLDREE